jgi:hypothetical protein
MALTCGSGSGLSASLNALFASEFQPDRREPVLIMVAQQIAKFLVSYVRIFAISLMYCVWEQGLQDRKDVRRDDSSR